MSTDFPNSLVISATLAMAPGSPSDGDRYIVPSVGASGWGSVAYPNVARWSSALPGWVAEVPVAGTAQTAQDTGATYIYDGSSNWQTSKTVRISAMPSLSLATLAATANTLGGVLEIDRDVSYAGGTLTAPVILFSNGNLTLSGNTTLAGICIFQGGKVIRGANSLTLSALDAGNVVCFDSTGTGTVTIAAANTTGVSVNARWFGATGDDTGMTYTDNAPPFAAAIKTLLLFTNGGELYVPTGTYGFATGLTVATNGLQNFSLRGDGRAASVLNSHLGTGGILLNISRSGSIVKCVKISDMGFTSVAIQTTATGEDKLVYLDYCVDALVTHCRFVGGFNIQLYVGRPQGTIISQSEFEGAYAVHNYSGVVGIAFGGSSSNDAGQAARISECVIRDFRVVPAMASARSIPLASAIGVSFYQASGTAPGSEFAVVDCDIESCDLGIDDNTGRNRIIRNSMESGGLRLADTSHVNIGTGLLTAASPPLLVGAQLGAYRITCTATAVGGGTFTVYDPCNGSLGTIAVGSPFATQIGFTSSAGGTDFHLGDQFIFNVVGSSIATAAVHVAGSAHAHGGSIDPDYMNPLPFESAIGAAGVYTVLCTGTGGGGTFEVYDPTGLDLGSLAAGTPFPMYGSTWNINVTAGSPAFAVGDSFTITAASDTLIRIGAVDVVQESLYAQNTLSTDAVGNGRFFDCVDYKLIQIIDNEFINPAGKNVFLGSSNHACLSMFRGNTRINARTGIHFDPALTDGYWQIEENLEDNSQGSGDYAPLTSTIPSVANLQTLVFQNSQNTTVTNFVNGYGGQELSVQASGAYATTLQNNANIVLTSGSDELVLGGSVYNFRATPAPGGIVPIWRQFNQYIAPPAFQTATSNYFAQGVTNGAPPVPLNFQAAVDQLVVALMGAGVWSTLDALWLFCVNDIRLACVNLKDAFGPYTMTWPAGTPNFSPYYGVTGTGTTYGYPTMDRHALTHYQPDDASLAVWAPFVSNSAPFAIGTVAGGAARLTAHVGTSVAAGRLNDTSTLMTPSGFNCLASISRKTGAGKAIYVNGVQGALPTGPAGTIASSDFFYLMRDGSTTPYNSMPLSMAAIGGGRDATGEVAFYNAVLPLMKKLSLA
ncbi:MAG TPA: DUF2793 domain-containing protein [Rhizomicrobium sp.]|jgi:hypothetical protein